MKRKQNFFFYPFFFVKVFVLLFAGVYSLSPVGMIFVYGISDVLMPVEAVVGGLVSVACFVWCGVEVWRCLKRS